MEWPEKAKRPGDGGTMGAARLKVGDLIAGVWKVSVSAAVGWGSDCGEAVGFEDWVGGWRRRRRGVGLRRGGASWRRRGGRW